MTTQNELAASGALEPDKPQEAPMTLSADTFIVDSENTLPALPALVLGKFPPTLNGQPCSYYRKEIARARAYPYTHRGQKSIDASGNTEFGTFDITPERMNLWIDSFTRRAAAGIKPFVPEKHVSDAGDARANFGYVVDLERQGDQLFGTFQLIGDEAEAVAARNDVSIYVTADAADADGGRYAECIEHVCLTPNPAIPHLEPFVKIAASAHGPAAIVPVYRLDLSVGPAVAPLPVTYSPPPRTGPYFSYTAGVLAISADTSRWRSHTMLAMTRPII